MCNYIILPLQPVFVTFYKTALQSLKDDKEFKKRLALDMIFCKF